MYKTFCSKVIELSVVALIVSGCGDHNELTNETTPNNEVENTEETITDSDLEESVEITFSPLSDAQDVVEWVNLNRYVGQWYEIATTPSQQQQVCSGTKAIYSPGEDGRINVTNQCNRGSLEGTVQTIDGYAEVVDETTNAKLEVTFFGFGAPYWVIALDGTESGEPYQWAVVSGPSDSSMWILSRTAQLTSEERMAIETHLEERGYDTSRLIDTAQSEAQDS